MDELQDVGEEQRLAAHAQRIIKSGLLGKSRRMIRLFEFLLERSLTATATKEIEIARVVFGRTSDADLAVDATVRVHVHRLRKKLEAAPADERGERLVLLRGEYRLVVVVAEQTDGQPDNPRPRLSGWRYIAGAAFLLVLNVGGWFWLMEKSPDDPRTESILWRGLTESSVPVLMVAGDFYVFGERGADGAVMRMIADARIASGEALNQFKQRVPEGQRYVDMNAYHLPNGLAPALGAVAPIVAMTRPGNAGLIKDVTTSRFTNEMLSNHDIVYVGLLDTLGDLQEPFFDISGFSLSASGDTLVDKASGERYQADWDEPSSVGIMRRDYAYLARFPGPAGNHIVVVAGVMDPALVEAGHIASDTAELARLEARLGDSEAFEALYEVRTFGPSNVSGKLLIARGLDIEQMWRGKEARSSSREAVPEPREAAR